MRSFINLLKWWKRITKKIYIFRETTRTNEVLLHEYWTKCSYIQFDTKTPPEFFFFWRILKTTLSKREIAHSITVIFWLTTSLDYIPTWSSSADNPKWNGHRRCSKSFQHYWQQYNSRFSSQIVRLTQKAMCVHLVPELDFLQRFRFSYSYVIFTFISLSFSRKSRWEVLL